MPRNPNAEIYFLTVLLIAVLTAVYHFHVKRRITDFSPPPCDNGEMCPISRGRK